MTTVRNLVGQDRRESAALRILNLEDDPLDTELIQTYLAQGGISCKITRVETRASFEAALKSGGFDLVLSDYSLPSFDGLSALELAKEICPEVPFVLISGVIGEERAIEALKSGATDYVIKQRLERLVPAVRRAVREREERTERNRIEEALRNNEQQYRTLVEQIPAVTYTQQIAEPRSGRTNPTLYASPQIESQSGYPPQAFVEDSELWIKLLHPEDRERVLAEDRRTDETGEPFKMEYRQMARSGRILWIRDEAVLVRDEKGVPRFWQGVMFDITERKEAEQALKESEERFRALVQNSSDVITVIDSEGTIRYVSPAVERVMGFRPEELMGKSVFDYVRPNDLAEAQEIFAAAWSQPGVHPPFEFELQHKDGSWRRAEFILNNLLDDPSVRGVVVNQRDITERKQAEEALRESHSLLHSLIDGAAESIFMKNSQGHYVIVNSTTAEIVGKPTEEILGKKDADLYPPEVADFLAEVDRRVMDTGGAISLEEGLPVAGTMRTYRSTKTPYYDHRGNVAGVIGVSTDITEHKKTEERLQEAEARYRTLIEQVPAVTYIQEVDHGGAISYVSPQIEELVGYSARDYVDDPTLWIRATHPDDRQRVLGEDARTDHTGEPFSMEYRKVRRDGEVIWVRDEAVLVRDAEGRPLYWQGILTDVTEHKRADEALRESEARFRLLAEKTGDLICLHEPDGRFLYLSPSCRRLLGYDPQELLGEDPYTLLHPDDAERIRSGTYTKARDGEASVSVPYRVRKKSGEYTWFETLTEPILDEAGKVVQLQTSSRDVSDRKHAEEALRQSGELYRTVIEQAAAGIFLVDVETKRILEANASLPRVLGYTHNELKKMTLYDVVGHDYESIDHNIGLILRQKRHSLGARRYRRKDGSLVDVEVNASVVPYGGKEVMCFVAHDVTKHKQVENELRRSLSVLLALREAGEVLGSTLESEEIVTRLLEIMRGVSDLTAAVISLRPASESEKFRIWRSVGLEELWPKVRFAPEAERARWAALESQEARLVHLRSPGFAKDQGLEALYLPLKVKDRVMGVLEAYGPELLASTDMAEVLSSLTSQAASALENARLYEELAERERALQDLVGKLLGAQEEERRRVAYEVHDELAQVAVAAHQHLQAFAQRYSPDAEKGRRDLTRILKLVRGTVSDARRIIANLRPTTLDDLGLEATILLEVERLREQGYRVDYVYDLGEERLPGALEIALFRVAQEALTNMRKHAQARWVRIEMRREAEEVYLEIEDDGRGFDPAAASLGGGPGERVGLAGMRERISALGGTLEIGSSHGAGTFLTARVPLTRVR